MKKVIVLVGLMMGFVFCSAWAEETYSVDVEEGTLEVRIKYGPEDPLVSVQVEERVPVSLPPTSTPSPSKEKEQPTPPHLAIREEQIPTGEPKN